MPKEKCRESVAAVEEAKEEAVGELDTDLSVCLEQLELKPSYFHNLRIAPTS